MQRTLIIFCLFFLSIVSFAEAASEVNTETVTINIESQHAEVVSGVESALAVRFKLKKDWHFYASATSAPGGMNIKVIPESVDGIVFGEVVFPKSHKYFDKSSNATLDVYSDEFTIYVPFVAGEDVSGDISIGVTIGGAICSDIQCRVPNFGKLMTVVKVGGSVVMGAGKFVMPKSVAVSGGGPGYSMWFAFGLALLAGLTLNIMPCVWPVLPLIVMRIVEQSKDSKAKAISMGLAFCFGIVLFFACLAGANIILQLVYGTALQWGDQFRNPAFVAGMALLLIVLAFFMFGMFTISVPSSIASKQGSGKGYAGSVGMGFLAAVLSTPCSFGLLAAAFAWAQAQPLVLGTLAILAIGVGMAIPYAILTSMPGLLKRLPRGGTWMELFKEGIGFVLLLIAVKLIGALPGDLRISVLYFSVILGFCIWMWGGWVSFGTKMSRKVIVRGVAVGLAVFAGMSLLGGPKEKLIDWQDYDSGLISSSLAAKRSVLIKFTAAWCLSCQVAERKVYSRSDVADLIKRKGVLAIKADTTTRDMPATDALKNLYNEPGVPVSMLFVPGASGSVRWHGMNFGDELKEHLEGLEDKQ
ncbi:MAG: DUF255 domain-containing protein [Planctomycetes bacterium]|nr:DUF255 domain-containing protein [Planctomycetota bacterium]